MPPAWKEAAANADVVSPCDPGQGSATEKEGNTALMLADWIVGLFVGHN